MGVRGAPGSSDEWATPAEIFDPLNAEFGFDLDVCATSENAKCARYFTREQEGRRQQWTGVIWCNPPYGREISGWMWKAWAASLDGATVVCLVPARTDTRWWHDYVIGGRAEVRFLPGRIKFEGRDGSGGRQGRAPFPSAVVIFRPPISEAV